MQYADEIVRYFFGPDQRRQLTALPEEYQMAWIKTLRRRDDGAVLI